MISKIYVCVCVWVCYLPAPNSAFNVCSVVNNGIGKAFSLKGSTELSFLSRRHWLEGHCRKVKACCISQGPWEWRMLRVRKSSRSYHSHWLRTVRPATSQPWPFHSALHRETRDPDTCLYPSCLGSRRTPTEWPSLCKPSSFQTPHGPTTLKASVPRLPPHATPPAGGLLLPSLSSRGWFITCLQTSSSLAKATNFSAICRDELCLLLWDQNPIQACPSLGPLPHPQGTI